MAARAVVGAGTVTARIGFTAWSLAALAKYSRRWRRDSCESLGGNGCGGIAATPARAQAVAVSPSLASQLHSAGSSPMAEMPTST